jgi:hypothetical protein
MRRHPDLRDGLPRAILAGAIVGVVGAIFVVVFTTVGTLAIMYIFGGN